MHTTIIEPSSSIPALESIERASIDLQIATARRYPRVLSKVKEDMLSFATLDQETAESCFYSVPRGGKNIQGPSVRLAEIALSCYGNLRAGARVLEVVATGDNPHCVIQAVCHDLEKNTAISIEKRRRITKKKSKAEVDEDDINLACNAGSAIAFRDAVFKVVPLALIKPVYEKAKEVAIGDTKTLSDRRSRGFAAFAKMGVREATILAWLGKRKVDDVDIADLEKMIGTHNAVRDGELSVDDAFPSSLPPEPPKFPEASPVSDAAGWGAHPHEEKAPDAAEPHSFQRRRDAGPKGTKPKDASKETLFPAADEPKMMPHCDLLRIMVEKAGYDEEDAMAAIRAIWPKDGDVFNLTDVSQSVLEMALNDFAEIETRMAESRRAQASSDE